jgi:hypothetical protein
MLSDNWYEEARDLFTDDQRDYAQLTLEGMRKERDHFMEPGRRNNDAVNLMIVSAGLGIPPQKVMWLDEYIGADIYNVTEEHFDELRERIEPYLETWVQRSDPNYYMIDTTYLP